MWVLAESIRGRVEIVNAALPDFDYRTGGAPLEGPRAERIGRSVHGAAPSVLDRSRNATSGPPGPQPTHLARARGLPPAIGDHPDGRLDPGPDDVSRSHAALLLSVHVQHHTRRRPRTARERLLK